MVAIISPALDSIFSLFKTIAYLILVFFFTFLFFYLQWKIIQIYTWMAKSLYPIGLYLYERFVAIKSADSDKAHKSQH